MGSLDVGYGKGVVGKFDTPSGMSVRQVLWLFKEAQPDVVSVDREGFGV